MDPFSVEKLQGHDQYEWSRLESEFFPRVYFYVKKQVRDHQTAEDLTQETFLHALRGLHTLDLGREVRFGGWLSAIARNVARKHSIRQRGSNTVQFDETCFPDVMGAAGAQTEDYSALAQCLDLLGIELRRPVLYKFFLGFPNRKIATLLTSSEATVRNRLASAMVELRACIESKGASFEKTRLVYYFCARRHGVYCN